MKKNVMMRVASALLVAVLMTTCAISGTFAKYTTTGSATDNARVAKWGVTVEVTGNDAFATKYNDTAADDGVKVVSTENVVAPGTNGTLATVAIAGTPEVAVEVVVVADLVLSGWEISGNEYCPLVIKVGETTITKTGTVAEFETAVETAVVAALKQTQLNAGANIADSLEVTWEWAFRTGADEDAKEANDILDTELAKLADAGHAPTIKFTCEVTVNQVD